MTFSTFLATFESLLSNFCVTLAGAPKVTFESLVCVFEFLGVSGSVGALPGHNRTPLIKGVRALTPLIKEAGLKKHCKTRGFEQSAPLIEGVNLHRLN